MKSKNSAPREMPMHRSPIISSPADPADITNAEKKTKVTTRTANCGAVRFQTSGTG